MTLALTKLGTSAGIAAEGIALNRNLDGATIEALHRALMENLVLCIRGQSLTPEAYLAAMRHFGTPLMQTRAGGRHREVPEIMILSSEDRDDLGDGERIVVGAHWHSDDSYKAIPCSLTMLYGLTIPPTGGDTQFTNMYAAYDDLPAETRKRIGHLRVVHKYDSPRKGTRVAKLTAEEERDVPDVTHPLVRTHPETGRKALYLNPNRMDRIVGMERAESDRLLDELIAHATQERYQYRHRWRQGDILIWDNRCTMHKATADYPEAAKRHMLRIIVEGTVPV